jgi:site-specific DNA-methyltransferase (adenine-specific)
MSFDIQCRDCLEWLEGFGPEAIDLIITDPAYESLEKYRKIGTTTRLKKSAGSSNEWFPIFPNGAFPALFNKCYRALKKNTHLYILCDQETGFLIKPLAEQMGFKFWKAIIWDKVAPGMGYHYRAQHEWIMFFEKGKRRLNTNNTPDVLRVQRVSNGYPTEKPVDLLRHLVINSSNPGELVIDPFTGSGATGVAALMEGRHFYGCDIKQEAVDLATNRLTEIVKEVP